jgi:hypothetical protein
MAAVRRAGRTSCKRLIRNEAIVTVLSSGSGSLHTCCKGLIRNEAIVTTIIEACEWIQAKLQEADQRKGHCNDYETTLMSEFLVVLQEADQHKGYCNLLIA